MYLHLCAGFGPGAGKGFSFPSLNPPGFPHCVAFVPRAAPDHHPFLFQVLPQLAPVAPLALPLLYFLPGSPAFSCL